ncbi:TrmH family RNA methyltransferase [Brevibacterium album]|uniref:TrmH family RNA methyltransferase n=1 Tax=Brevibacterium album TaxID=417948 RepID=UPI00041F0DD9|nr:RNA methyltransferase [Brevibacterium album]
MNTPRKPEPTDAEIRELAQRWGIAGERIVLIDGLAGGEADSGHADGAGSLLGEYERLTDVRLRSSSESDWGLYIAESTKIIERALAAGHRPRSFFMTREWFARLAERLGRGSWAETACPILIGSEARVESLTGYHLHRGALASMHRPALAPVEDVVARAAADAEAEARHSRIAVFENLVDHTNLGAAFRSAAALGVDAVLVTPSCADPLYRRAIRVSMGTVFQVPWTRIEEWPAGIGVLQEAGYIVAGMTLGAGAITMRELVAEEHARLALVLGTEGQGLTPAADRLLDRRVTIPMMHGVDSLNVAASAAVAFYAMQ